MRVLLLLPLFFFIACSIPAQRRPASAIGNSCFFKIQTHFHEDQNEVMKTIEEISRVSGREEIHILLKSIEYQEIFKNAENEIEKEYFASILSLLKKDNPNSPPNKIKEAFFDFFKC